MEPKEKNIWFVLIYPGHSDNDNDNDDFSLIM